MKKILIVIGVLLMLVGSIFFLQGVNILPGSSMTGDPQWVINGAVVIIVGIGFILWARRK